MILNNKGFTVTELVITMFLSSIVAGMVFLNYMFINKTVSKWQKRIGFEQEITRKVQSIDYEIRHLTDLDSVGLAAIWYFNKTGKRDSIKLSMGYFKFTGSNMATDRNADKMIDSVDFDKNTNGRIDREEMADIDFIQYLVTFTDKKGKKYNFQSKNRLINRKLKL